MRQELVVTSVSFKPNVIEKADKIVTERLIPGVNNRSGLIEYALRKVFKEVFKEAPETMEVTDPGSVAPHVLTMDKGGQE